LGSALTHLDALVKELAVQRQDFRADSEVPALSALRVRPQLDSGSDLTAVHAFVVRHQASLAGRLRVHC
jgi:hypothetical protein